LHEQEFDRDDALANGASLAGFGRAR